MSDRPPHGHATTVLVGMVFWFGWLALLGLVGPASEAERTVTAAGCLAIASLGARQQDGMSARLLWSGLALALFLAPTDLGRAAAYPLLGHAMLPKPFRSLNAWTALALFAVKAMEALPSLGRFVAESLGGLASATVSGAPGAELSTTALAGGPLLAASMVILGAGRHKPRRAAACLAALGLLWGLQFQLFAGLVTHTQLYWHHGHGPEPYGQLVPFGITSGLLVSIAVLGGQRDHGQAPARSRLATALGLPIVGVLIGHVLAGAPSWTDDVQRSVTFVNYGGLDWERPHTGEVGAFSGGMFGLLPQYLERADWSVSTIFPEELEAELVDASGVLVMINCPVEWDASQRERIHSFVEAGGSLLVLGDHTDIFGCAKGFNPLLDRYGIEFEFDSAYHDGGSWLGDMQWSGFGHQPSKWSRDARIAIGASLSLSGSSVPLAIGRYGFSDHGIRSNEAGAFLGNYQHDPEERLGDCVVVAASFAGAGQVRVYGDTSAFQNGSLSSSFTTHVLPTFEDLARPQRLIPRAPLWPIAWVLTLTLLATATWRWSLLPLLLGGLLLGASLRPAATLAAGPVPAVVQGALIVDQSHAPRVGDYGARWNDPWPMSISALRTGLEVFEVERWDPDLLETARSILIVAPTRAYSVEEQVGLRAFIQGGGTLVLAASGGDASVANTLLEPYGIHITRPHQGNVPRPEQRRDDQPHLADASALALQPLPGDVTLLASGQQIYGVARPVDRGWLIVVGDTRFFSTENVESVQGYSKGNVRFLIDLCIEYLGGTLDAPTTTLPDPVEVDANGRPE